MTDQDVPLPANVDPLVHQFLLCTTNFQCFYEKFDHTKTPSQKPVSVIQTHCACLYLAEDFVVKIKRSVAYSYINLGTLEQRRRICQREMDVNQAALPDIYLGIGAIVKNSDNSLSITFEYESLSSEESVIEWFVVMRRFNESQVLRGNRSLNITISCHRLRAVMGMYALMKLSWSWSSN